MKARRYELTDFEWSIIQPLLPNMPRGKPQGAEWHLLAIAHRLALG
jgi:transposase